MKAIGYAAGRENVASTMNQDCDDHDPVIITRNREQAVVMLSLADYESFQESAYLLKSPTNTSGVSVTVALPLLPPRESKNGG